MAEIPLQGQAQPRSGGRGFSTITSYAGAVVSLGLIVGIGVWGYGVLSRDVSGVPVVKAASNEPMRVAPEDPGGELAQHQGLSVNEVMAQGASERAGDRLVLAPKPVDLTEDDQPLAGVSVQAPASSVTEAAVASADVEEAELSPQLASIRALTEQLTQGAAPLADLPEREEPETVTPAAPVDLAAAVVAAETAPAAEAEVDATPKPVEAKGRSLRPKLRPQALRTAAAEPAATVASEAPEAAAVQNIPAGTRLVQLGAFDSAEIAQAEWTRLSARFGDYLGGKERVVMKAESGGRTFYRLRAMGFANLSDARRFCAALMAEKADCIPVVAK